MKLRVTCPGPGGLSSGLWLVEPAAVGEWLDWRMATTPRLRTVTFAGRSSRVRSEFDKWLDGEVACLVAVPMPDGPVEQVRWLQSHTVWLWVPDYRLMFLKQVGPSTARMSVDVGQLGLDDLDLSAYIDAQITKAGVG